MQALNDFREQRGHTIAEVEGQVRRIDANSYKVNSQSGSGLYDILSTESGWICSCPDHVYRGVKCKHQWAVEFSLAIRREVQASTVIQPLNTHVCQFCGSDKVVKNSKRHNKYGELQRYLCKTCMDFIGQLARKITVDYKPPRARKVTMDSMIIMTHTVTLGFNLS